MKKNNIILFFLLIVCHVSFAQYNGNLWYFGTKAGINFATNPPTSLSNSVMTSNKGSAVLSNSLDGSLLFYTDGATLYNKNHQATPNGTGLNGNGQCTQSAYFLPYPGQPKKVILFTVDAWGTLYANTKGLCYSVIQIDTTTGLGDIISGQKNILLIKPTAEKLAITKHANGTDYWVVTHGVAATNNENQKFFSYLVTSAGVSSTPVVSTVGNTHANPIGEMNISPNGQKLFLTAFYDNWAQLFNFNNSTGQISSPTTFNIERCLGVEFSPNSDYVYVTETGPSNDNIVKRIKLSNNTVTTLSTQYGYYVYSSLATAPNGKIYIGSYGASSLSCIVNPNDENASVQNNSLPLAPNTTSNLGMPYATSMPININSCAGLSTPQITGNALVCSASSPANTTLSVQSPQSNITYLWSNGSTGSNIVINTTGNYSVRAISNGCTSGISNTVAVQIVNTPNPPIITGNNTDCISGTATISINNPQSDITYVWNNGMTGTSINVSVAGSYRARAVMSGCTSDVSNVIPVTLAPAQPVAINNTPACSNASVTLSVANPISNVKYLWSNGSIGASIVVNTFGLFSVQAIANNCTSSVSNSLSVQPQVAPPIIYGNPTNICLGTSTTVSIDNPQPNTTYLWSNGQTGTSVSVKTTTTLTAKAIANGCTSSVSNPVTISLKSTDVNAGIDTSICSGSTMNLPVSSTVQNTWFTLNPLALPDQLSGNAITLFNDSDIPKKVTCIAKAEANGCIAYDTTIITVYKIAIDASGNFICGSLEIPNVITINNDGKNDVFKIKGLELFASNKLSIYNRWGKKVYEQENYANTWNGDSVNGGIYFYSLELFFAGNVKKYKGWIDVLK